MLNRDVKKQVVSQFRVVIYARVSQDRRGKRISVESQVTIGRRWCEHHGFVVVAVLRDNDLSASPYATKERPDYKRVLSLLAGGEANVLWTFENARAQRDTDIFFELRKILKSVGGFWAYDDDLYDMSDPDDRIAVTEDAIDAEKEAVRLSKRSKRGVETRALDGLWHGSLSFGYRNIYSDRTGEVVDRVQDLAQAPVAAEIVAKLLEGYKQATLVRALNARGIRPARAHRWTARHTKRLERILRDPKAWRALSEQLTLEQLESVEEVRTRLAAGDDHSLIAHVLNAASFEHVFPGQWDAAKVRNVALNPVLAGLRVWHGEVVGPGRWEKIIEPEDHQAIKVMFGDPGRKRQRDGDRVVHELSGILLCGKCDEGAVSYKRPIKSNPERRGYRCPHGHATCPEDVAEAFVTEALLRRLEAPDAVELFKVQAQSGDLAAAIAESKRLRATLDETADAVADGTVQVEALRRITARLQPKIDAAERRIREAGANRALIGIVGPQAREVWATLSKTQRRDVFRAVLTPRILPLTSKDDEDQQDEQEKRTKRKRGEFDVRRLDLVWLTDISQDPIVETMAA
jgi:site-specific DNA recombinase